MSVETVLDGLYFPESPRWHNNRLWFSDFYGHQVSTLDGNGHRQVVAEVPGQPSGIGWLPDDTLLVVSMTDRTLLRLHDNAMQTVADLSPFAPFYCNDMLVDEDGHAYVGHFGFNHYEDPTPQPASLLRVDPSGEVSVAAPDVYFPNGMALSPDAAKLLVAETYTSRITAFRRHGDGVLSERRVWADLRGEAPDGMCLDASGAAWVALPRGRQFIRIAEGGEVLDVLDIAPRKAVACVLGGVDLRTLYLCTTDVSGPQAAEKPTGRIEAIRVPVPGF